MINSEYEFMPATNENERTALRHRDVLVFVYTDDDGYTRVTVDTENADRPVPLIVKINDHLTFLGEVD